jgi:hypothetical protein
VFISKAGAKVESFLLSTKCFGKKIVTFFQHKCYLTENKELQIITGANNFVRATRQ